MKITDTPRKVELTEWEHGYLTKKVGVDLMCYIGHGDKLFPKEKREKARVKRLYDKLEKAS